MDVFTIVLPPAAHADTKPVHAHIPDYSQHAAEEINGSSVAWPQVGRACGGAGVGGDPFESPVMRDRV